MHASCEKKIKTHKCCSFCSFFVLLHFYHDAKKYKKIHRKELNKRRKEAFHFNMTLSRGAPLPTHTHTELTWHATMGTCRIKVWTDRVSAHRPPLLIYNSYPEGVMTFLIWNLTFKYFYHCTGTSFPTLYIHFQPETESLTPAVEI